MIRAQRHVVLAVGRHLRCRVLDGPGGVPEVELQVPGATLPSGEPDLACIAFPVGRLRAVARALAELAGELGVRP